MLFFAQIIFGHPNCDSNKNVTFFCLAKSAATIGEGTQEEKSIADKAIHYVLCKPHRSAALKIGELAVFGEKETLLFLLLLFLPIKASSFGQLLQLLWFYFVTYLHRTWNLGQDITCKALLGIAIFVLGFHPVSLCPVYTFIIKTNIHALYFWR